MDILYIFICRVYSRAGRLKKKKKNLDFLRSTELMFTKKKIERK